MNGVSGRSAAFLDEMGIGPLWTLRGSVDAEAAPAPAAPVYAGPTAPPTQARIDAEAAARAQPPAPADAAPAPAVYAGPTAPPTQARIDAEAAARAHPPALADAAPAPAVYVGPSAAPTRARIDAEAAAWAEQPPAPPVSDAEIAQMDWPQLQAAVASCTRCGLCKSGRKPVFGSGARQAVWLVAAGATTSADEREGQPLAGDPGKLLANMLAAVGHARGVDTWVTNLIKCRPTSASGADRAPSADEAAACRPYLERELALSGAGTVLTLGQIAANALLGQPLQTPLAGTRGSVHALNQARLVATLHPGELLRRGADKALAWADLCMAAAADVRAE